MNFTITLSPLQVYAGIILNAIATGIGTAFGQWIFSHIKEKVKKKNGAIN